MVCNKCGKQIQQEYVACPFCGDKKSNISSNNKMLKIVVLVMALVAVGYFAWDRLSTQNKANSVEAKVYCERIESLYNNKDFKLASEVYQEMFKKYPNNNETKKAQQLLGNIDELITKEATIKQEIANKANKIKNEGKITYNITPKDNSAYAPAPSPSNSRPAARQHSAGPVVAHDAFVATSRDSFDLLTKFSAERNQAAIVRMIARGEVFIVNGGTGVSIIDRGFIVHRIEIEDGDKVGLRGYVPVEFVID